MKPYNYFSLIKQNPTIIDYLPTIGLISCNMNKVQLNVISPDKDGNLFCTGPSVSEEYETFFDQGHGMTLNIFPDTQP